MPSVGCCSRQPPGSTGSVYKTNLCEACNLTIRTGKRQCCNFLIASLAGFGSYVVLTLCQSVWDLYSGAMESSLSYISNREAGKEVAEASSPAGV